MNFNIKSITLVLAFFAALSVWAQDSVLVKEVTVSQEFNPTVNDAFKIGTIPTTDDPEAYVPSFEYSFFNAPLRTSYEIQFIGADDYSPEEPAALGRENYIKGGFGNYSTLMGELFYNAYNSEEQNVNIFYRNRSSWGDVKLQDDTKVDAPNFSNYGKVDFQRRYRHSVLYSDFTFNRLGYKYYGYDTMMPGIAHVYQDDNTEVVSETGKQTLTNFAFDFSLNSLPRRGAYLRYELDFAFNSFSNDDRFSENQFDVSALFEKEFKKLNVGIDAAFNVGFYGDADATVTRQYMGETYFGIGVAPYVSLQKKNLDLKVGFDVELYQMDIEQEMLVSPVLEFNYNIVPKYFSGYITAQGGITQNNYAQVATANPFVANDINREATRTPLDASAGIIGHPTKALSLKLGVNYQIIKNQLFYVNEFVNSPSYLNVLDGITYTNRFVAAYDDNNVLAFHGEASYNSFKKWSVSAAADFYSYSLTTYTEAWNMPAFKLSAFGHYDVSDKIKVKGSFSFLPERPVMESQSGDVAYFPVTYDLSLSGEYKFRDNLSFFLDMNNMAASKYYLYNGYPTYRFNALVGATFRF